MIPMNEMDACELLDADHIAVKHLFVDYARLAVAAPDGSATERRELADRICAELTEIFPMARTAGLDLGALAEQLRARQGELMPAAAA